MSSDLERPEREGGGGGGGPASDPRPAGRQALALFLVDQRPPADVAVKPDPIVAVTLRHLPGPAADPVPAGTEAKAGETSAGGHYEPPVETGFRRPIAFARDPDLVYGVPPIREPLDFPDIVGRQC